ncbi:MAG: hypothetical protein WBO04_13635 [Steroidobacteraceae bacterium]
MTFKTRLSLAALLLLAGAAAQAACIYPQAPQEIPNGAKATKEEMLATQAAIKEYTAAVQETYLPCLEQETNEALVALDPADPDYAARKGAIEAIHAKKHNAALDELLATADRWNAERKAFTDKSKQ